MPSQRPIRSSEAMQYMDWAGCCILTRDGCLWPRERPLSGLDAGAVGAHGAPQEVPVRQRRSHLQPESRISSTGKRQAASRRTYRIIMQALDCRGLRPGGTHMCAHERPKRWNMYACRRAARSGTSVTSQRSRTSGMMRSTARHITCSGPTGNSGSVSQRCFYMQKSGLPSGKRSHRRKRW